MTHYSRDVWTDYILGNMPEEKRKAYETHLYACSVCLGTYTDCLDELADRLPAPADERSFTENVMFAVESARSEDSRKLPGKEELERRWWKTSFFHYAVASVITLLFTVSGTFHTFTAEIQEASQKTLAEHHTPYSRQIIDKTTQWLDQFSARGGLDNE